MIDNIGNGTNHGSVVEYNGQWILFYHYWEISGFNKMRSMCADYLRFRDDGTVHKVIPSKRGILTPTIGDTIQIDRYNEINGAQTAFVGGDEPLGWMVCETPMMSWVKFDRVDFKNGEAKKIKARFAAGQRNGSFEVRLGNSKGKKIAEFPVYYTGGWSKWETIETDLLEEVKGVQNLVVVFKAEWGSTKVVNLNWLLLE